MMKLTITINLLAAALLLSLSACATAQQTSSPENLDRLFEEIAKSDAVSVISLSGHMLKSMNAQYDDDTDISGMRIYIMQDSDKDNEIPLPADFSRLLDGYGYLEFMNVRHDGYRVQLWGKESGSGERDDFESLVFHVHGDGRTVVGSLDGRFSGSISANQFMSNPGFIQMFSNRR